MFSITLTLAMIIYVTSAASTVSENSENSERLRYFEFADDNGQPQQQQPQPPPDYGGGDNLFRQVIVVPSKFNNGLSSKKVFEKHSNNQAPGIVTNGTTCTCIPTGTTCSGSTTGTTTYGDNQLDVRIVNSAGSVSVGFWKQRKFHDWIDI